ncbi:DMT family transporter [Motiliproteus sediminis]|uniref:DMT family transporter n=1 Tax=Motiliproteus sediminis TaxID=1468178 RepID=UPI001AEFD201|nr:DMT family transporter [Motiliproteus sediminis]
MPLTSAFNLLLLSAIWGGSFLFLRMGAPVLGPLWLIESRVSLAALFLLAVALLLRRRLALRQHWRHYLLLGGLNSALPFLLLAFAAQTLTVSLLSIVNATSPLWGALVGALWQREMPPRRALLGLLLGAMGVALLVGLDRITSEPGAAVAVAAALGAALCYGIASNYARHASAVEPFNNAHGSMWAATLWLLPATLWLPLPAMPAPPVAIAVLLLGILCTGMAYLLYFRLVAEVGPTSALTVTFLIPLFGVLWGWSLLDEQPGWHTLAGTLTILTGTALVTGFNPRTLWPVRSARHA